MFLLHRISLCGLLLISPVLFPWARAQAPETATATLREIHADGMKILSEPQVVGLSRLIAGSQVGKADLQTGADQLVQTGLFAKVSYNFQTRGEDVSVTFHVEESLRIPAYFDNIPWFSDSELHDAIRKKLLYYNGTLPEAGAAVDQATDAVNELLASHGLNVAVEHQVIGTPLGEGTAQEFHVQGTALQIASIEFSDPALTASKAIRQSLADLLGKPYSRMTIDLFLSEQVRPLYLQRGCLHVKLGPPELRLTGNPNQKLPEQLPVYVPITPGPVYHWKDVQWTGNSILSSFTLAQDLGLKTGDVADGMQVEAGWDRIREEYGHRGYLDAKIDPVASYDDQAHTISYSVRVHEGVQYRFGVIVLTGISLADERRLREVWPIPAGEAFDKAIFEEFLTKLQTHPAQVFGDLPVHFESVGHWLRTDPGLHVVDVLLDFK